MRHICAAIVFCTAASLGVGFAQKDIPTDTSDKLAAEWKDAPLSCLKALEIYTKFAGIFIPPAEGAAFALDELLRGILPGDLDSVRDLYKVAQRRADFLDMLAKANSLNTKPDGEDALFLTADTLIQAIYSTPPGKRHLADVQASSAEKNYHLALFQLLKAYPQSNPVGARSYALNLEILRACFKMNGDRLFKRVKDKIVGAS